MDGLGLGPVGVALNVSASYLGEAAELEELGYSAIWLPGGAGAIAAAAMRAWYLPWWVSRAWWLTSPRAYDQSSSRARIMQVSSTSS
jgi:hypothetical protein